MTSANASPVPLCHRSVQPSCAAETIADVDSCATLSAEEIRRFDRDGVVGPFPRFADDAILDRLSDFVLDVVGQRPGHPIYGHHPPGRFSVRDWHLANPDLLALLTDPAIVGRLASLCADPLVLWRSKIFHKPAGAGELAWHQEWGAFNGEEIGNDRPALVPVAGTADWNWTVWIALQDMTPQLGPIRFVRGSHRHRYPWQHVPMASSAFFTSFMDSCCNVPQIVARARANNLFLDLDTAALFRPADVALSLADVKARIAAYLQYNRAKLTLPFDIDPSQLWVCDSMKRGEFLIFTERTMHGSTANTTDRPRLAINARVTRASTLVYPQRFSATPIDGSNLDIRHHRCVALAPVGADANVYVHRDKVAVYGASPNARREATST